MPQNKKKVKFEISAGGIVFKKLKIKDERLKAMIAFILDPYRHWAFPKGHIKKGEKVISAALRETKEETGICDLKIIDKLGKMDFWFQQKGVLIHKLVYYFLMQTPDHSEMQPQKKEKIFKARWIEIDRALDFCGYKNTKPILKKAILKIKKLAKN